MDKTQQASKIFAALKAELGTAKTELIYNSPFELLIAVILAAQSTDVGVNKATALLFQHANTPAQIFALGEQQLKQYIKTIFFFYFII